MSTDLPAGGNVALERDGQPVHRVLVALGWRTPSGSTPFEVDAQMALLGADGRVADAGDLVPLAALGGAGPDGRDGRSRGVPDRGGPGPDVGSGADVEQVLVDLDAVPASVDRLSFSAAIYAAAPRGQSFRQVAGTYASVADADGRQIARHVLVPAPGAEQVTAVVLGELYRHRGAWKFRAVGQGYAGGLAAVARDVGAL